MRPTEVRNRHLFAWDVLGLALTLPIGFVLRFEGLDWPEVFRGALVWVLPLFLAIKIALFVRMRLYRYLWQYAGVAELQRILLVTLVSAVIEFTLGAFVFPGVGWLPIRIPLSVLALDMLLTGLVLATPRLAVRAQYIRSRSRSRDVVGEGTHRVLVVGAGASGAMIVRELTTHRQLDLDPVGFVDDDRSKYGHRVAGLPVLGALSDLETLIESLRIDRVIIAMPRAPGTVVRSVVRAAQRAGVRTQAIPGMYDILSGRVAVNSLRDVEIQDLLRREPVQTDLEQVRGLATGETVLVTGAGGSIGSELCRQLALLDPAHIVLLGHGENSIFEILHELEERFPKVRVRPVIADVRDRERMREVVERYRPYSVFHAAAHKHVPLMEANIAEAVSNNVLGTRNVVDLSAEFGVEHFVLISTDKAVCPTNVMGATKRVAEQIVQHVAQEHHKNFVAVRFGNVLGSRGSVVPTFLRQIRNGGPITITHPEMRRYFMTIPEAVELVLQAGALGKGGEVFVLDMGEPVKIVDLATDLIRLSGLEVGTDIEIRFSGTRPGEKLYEELFFGSEQAEATTHSKVLRARSAIVPMDVDRLVDEFITAALGSADDDELRGYLLGLVPDYAPTGAATPVLGRLTRASRRTA